MPTWSASITALRLRYALTATVVATVCLPILVSSTSTLPVGTRQATPVQDIAVAVPRLKVSELTAKYCGGCHNDRIKTGGFSLEGIDPDHVEARPDVWERVLQKLRTRAMPPANAPRPSEAAYSDVISQLESTLDAAAAAHRNPGPSAIHRLNRAEYANAIRDLLGLRIDERLLLPADDAGYGFDNIAEALSVSPMLMERYLVAAEKISRLAIGDPGIRPSLETYSMPVLEFQDDRMNEDLPFGSRGGLAIRHLFPADGEYEIQVRLQRTEPGCIRGLGRSHQLDIRLDGVLLKMFAVGGEAPGTPSPPGRCGSDYDGSGSIESMKWDRYMREADAGLHLRVTVTAGEHLVAVSFLNRTREPVGVVQPPLTGFGYNVDEQLGANSAIDSVTIGGPYGVTSVRSLPSRQRIFLCQPARSEEEEACARTILVALARSAYRRNVSADDVNALMTFFQSGRDQEGFDEGVRRALARLLVDPEFLFRIEGKNLTEKVVPVNGFELASRLSFFLWSSIPDTPLLDLAASGSLNNPHVLEQQVRRMLADRRADALVANFAGQWLYLRNMRAVSPDPDTFPEFDENLRRALEQETTHFFSSQLREDRSVLELLTADYTFLNERLARHYGIPGIYGSHFRRVSLADDMRRGLLGQGSVLTVTSYATRTSPVVRGMWVLENLLGAPPPPPPPNVPGLKENGTDGGALSIRQRMEEHRKNPACAACHARMDPVGFALENFDAIGRWRTMSEAKAPVDATGALPDGTTFDGPAGLRQLLLDRRDQFVTTVTEKLLTYALGRGLGYYDAAAVRAIMRGAAVENYRWSSIILGIIKSTPFQMRRDS